MQETEKHNLESLGNNFVFQLLNLSSCKALCK